MQSNVILASLVILISLWSASLGLESLATTCRDFKVFILDYNDLAIEIDLSPCRVEDNIVVEMATGTVFPQANQHSPDSPDYDAAAHAHHQFGTHAAPWLMLKELRDSGCIVDDIGAAQLVYVDLYCPYTTWLAAVHLYKNDVVGETPADDIVKVYEHIQALPRWQLHNGRDFMFFDPHPGFARGRSAVAWVAAWCHELRDAVQLVPDGHGNGRLQCTEAGDMPTQLVLVPYVPNAIDTHHAASHKVPPSLDMRPTLLYARVACASEENPYMGKILRTAVVEALQGSAADVDVQCSNSGHGSGHIAFKHMLHATERSVFALALAGDSPSSRRLSEIFMAGAIPVFVGPPFHTMPFAGLVDYSDLGLIFNITGAKPWLDDSQGPIANTLPLTLEAPGSGQLDVIEVADAGSVVEYLREMPDEEKARRLTWMKKLRGIMSYTAMPADSWDANKAILQTVKGMVLHPHHGGHL